jgi:hypothetical protein
MRKGRGDQGGNVARVKSEELVVERTAATAFVVIVVQGGHGLFFYRREALGFRK